MYRFISTVFAMLFCNVAFSLTCYINTPTDPSKDANIYDKALYTAPFGPGYPSFRRILVKKDASSAFELSQEERDRRVAETDFKDLDGDLLVILELNKDLTVMTVTERVVDAAKDPDNWNDGSTTFGASPLNIINYKRLIWVFCVEEKKSTGFPVLKL